MSLRSWILFRNKFKYIHDKFLIYLCLNKDNYKLGNRDKIY